MISGKIHAKVMRWFPEQESYSQWAERSWCFPLCREPWIISTKKKPNISLQGISRDEGHSCNSQVAILFHLLHSKLNSSMIDLDLETLVTPPQLKKSRFSKVFRHLPPIDYNGWRHLNSLEELGQRLISKLLPWTSGPISSCLLWGGLHLQWCKKRLKLWPNFKSGAWVLNTPCALPPHPMHTCRCKRCWICLLTR